MTNLDFFAVRVGLSILCFFFSSRRRHTRFDCDWSSDVWSSDLSASSAMFYLVEEADAFVYDLVRRNNGKNLAWDTFKSEIRECYERPTIHSDLLHKKLENVRYEGRSEERRVGKERREQERRESW